MTVHIPLRLVGLLLYTCALCGASAGISYGVYRWQHDPYAARVEEDLQRLDARGSALRGDVSALSARVAAAESAGTRHRTCHVTILNIILYLSEGLRTGPTAALQRDIEEAVRSFNETC